MKKIYLILSLSLTFLILSIVSCGGLTSSDKSENVTISGKVVDAGNNPIEDAVVRIISPPPEKVVTTDSLGKYSFALQVDSSTTVVIEARKAGLQTKKEEILAVPDRNIELPDFKLTSTDSTGGGDEDVSESDGSAYISLENVSTSEIQVSGTGGTETSKLNFVVTDSLGNPISNDNAVYVNFEILEGPGGGEAIYPDSALTENGKVTATLKSGTTAGVVQVQASFSRNQRKGSPKLISQTSNFSVGLSSGSGPSDPLTQETVTYETKPVSVTISGGLPSQDHFYVDVESKNQVASAANQSNMVSVQLGDKYGNDVPEGTSVYFSTDKGTITRSATTNSDGQASATLKSNGVSPGTAQISVETVDENSQTISKQLSVIFSGSPDLSVTPASVSLDGFTQQEFTYTLQDANSNPLSEGTNVKVSVDNENLTLSGDTDITLSDVSSAGDGSTDFSFTLTNPDGTDIYTDGTVTISTDGPNGSATETIALNAPDAPTLTPGSITLNSVSNSELGVIETGQTEQSKLTFQVKDSSGAPLNADNPVDVSFSLGSAPNGGEDVSPKTVTTDVNGMATTTLTSGTKSGIVQVIAEAKASDGTTISSKPAAVTIHAGMPAQDHFTLSREKKNVNYDEDKIPAEKVTFTVYAGDKYNNTVPEGTPIYFKTTGGYIEGSAKTNADGEASATLTAKKKFPTGGVATITAESVNDSEQTISDDTKLIFSTDPTITASPSSIDLTNFQSQEITYTLQDANSNPLSEGTSIKVSVDNENLSLSGNSDVTLGDNFQSGDGATDFSFTLTNPDGTDIYTDGTVTISTDGPNGSATETIALNAPNAPTLTPGSITLSNVTNNEIGVINTGQTEQTKLTFQVSDSSGQTLNLDNQTEVNFSLGANPGGGTALENTTVMTDADGKATTTLTSGTEAGVVQVLAEVTASDGTTITSQPVSVTIHAGLPDADHFSISSSTKNVPAESGQDVAITAYVGDKHGNIVAEGTSIYFTTDGGYISGSAQTNSKGRASATLTAVSPTPGDGIATITASTADDQNQTITASKDIIFSGGPSITVSPNSIDMANDTSQTFNYTVKDANGFPMAPGTNISVNVEANEVDVIGDIDITLGEPTDINNTSALTDFTFNVNDAAGDTTATDPIQITITADGPNGSAKQTISGTKRKGTN